MKSPPLAPLSPKRSPYPWHPDAVRLDEWELELLRAFNQARTRALRKCRRTGQGSEVMIVHIAVEPTVTEIRVQHMTPGEGWSYADSFEAIIPRPKKVVLKKPFKKKPYRMDPTE